MVETNIMKTLKFLLAGCLAAGLAVAQDQSAAPAAPNDSPPPQSFPSHLTIKPGTYVTVRLEQPLSSDRNQVGDAFSATLARPIIVDGIVVAQPGQVLGGRVAEVQKAGRVSGVSRLGVELTDLPIADGQQVPIKTTLTGHTGPSTQGHDAAAIAGTTATGAAIGAAVGWGTGAAIGAGAGAAISVLGVLLTRGAPTVMYPETVLTFRLESAVTISTERAPQMFRYASDQDYQTQQSQQPRLMRRAAGPGYPGSGYAAPGYGAPPPPYYAPAYYPPYPYWGPGFGVVIGPGYYGPRGYYYRRW
jgi:hypothetical protein